MSTLAGYKCSFLTVGDADFLEEVAIPFASSIEELVPPYKEKLPEPLRIPRNIQNNPFSLVVLGVTIFVASHLTKKILDDVYSTIIEPRLKPFLKKIDAKLKKKGKTTFNISIWYSEFNALVSVNVVGDTFADIESQLPLLKTVHVNALAWIAVHGVQKPIHHYVLEKGNVNATPLLTDTVQEALRQATF